LKRQIAELIAPCASTCAFNPVLEAQRAARAAKHGERYSKTFLAACFMAAAISPRSYEVLCRVLTLGDGALRLPCRRTLDREFAGPKRRLKEELSTVSLLPRVLAEVREGFELSDPTEVIPLILAVDATYTTADGQARTGKSHGAMVWYSQPVEPRYGPFITHFMMTDSCRMDQPMRTRNAELQPRMSDSCFAVPLLATDADSGTNALVNDCVRYVGAAAIRVAHAIGLDFLGVVEGVYTELMLAPLAEKVAELDRCDRFHLFMLPDEIHAGKGVRNRIISKRLGIVVNGRTITCTVAQVHELMPGTAGLVESFKKFNIKLQEWPVILLFTVTSCRLCVWRGLTSRCSCLRWHLRL
jgi:hypothetical protein